MRQEGDRRRRGHLRLKGFGGEDKGLVVGFFRFTAKAKEAQRVSRPTTSTNLIQEKNQEKIFSTAKKEEEIEFLGSIQYGAVIT
ncbi:hypothetical protein U1Q18_031805 [Sarracenia purpurea var. burkii]